MNITTIGLDVAKNVFQVHAADTGGRAVLRKRLGRSQVAGFFANLPPCLVWSAWKLAVGLTTGLVSPGRG